MHNPIHEEHTCPCPDCFIDENTRRAFDIWWKSKDRPVSARQLNLFDSYGKLYIAALYGYNAGLNGPNRRGK